MINLLNWIILDRTFLSIILRDFFHTNNSKMVIRCVRQVCLSVRRSVRHSVRSSTRPSVTPLQKLRFSAVFGHGEILHWNKWSTNMFWEPPLLVSRFTRLFIHLSLHICHMINSRRNTVRTHLCPVGLVSFDWQWTFFSNTCYMERQRDKQTYGMTRW